MYIYICIGLKLDYIIEYYIIEDRGLKELLVK